MAIRDEDEHPRDKMTGYVSPVNTDGIDIFPMPSLSDMVNIDGDDIAASGDVTVVHAVAACTDSGGDVEMVGRDTR